MPNPHTAAVDLSSLLDGSSAGELIPEMVRNGLQQLIQLELAAFLGADWHERTLVIHGEQDDTVALSSVMDWARPQALPVTVIPGVAHFFHGQLPLLRSLVVRHLQA